MWDLRRRRAGSIAPGVIVAAAIILAGCEAPLVLDGVEHWELLVQHLPPINSVESGVVG